jgi:hypothetical protein
MSQLRHLLTLRAFAQAFHSKSVTKVVTERTKRQLGNDKAIMVGRPDPELRLPAAVAEYPSRRSRLITISISWTGVGHAPQQLPLRATVKSLVTQD